jgi:hypothetical protein
MATSETLVHKNYAEVITDQGSAFPSETLVTKVYIEVITDLPKANAQHAVICVCT